MEWFPSTTGSRKARWYENWFARWGSRNATSNSTATAAAVGTAVRCFPARCSYTRGSARTCWFSKRAIVTARDAPRAERANDVKGDAQFTTPFGIHHAAATFGPIATAHMARYGTTTLDFAHLAVTERSHAALNQKAMMRKPITIYDHQSSRWIIYPFRLLDCCQERTAASLW